MGRDVAEEDTSGPIFLKAAMALNIKDPETDALVRELVAATGERITDAVKTAVRERLDREQRRRRRASVEEILAIASRIAADAVHDPRPADEILGYDANGLPS